MSEYEFYKKDSNGRRGSMIERFSSFDVSFRFNESTKWTLKGKTNTFCPFSESDGLFVFRDGICIMSGFVTAIDESVDCIKGQYDWIVSGLDDLARFEFRLILPDPVDYDFTAAYDYSLSGYTDAALYQMIDANAGPSATNERKILNLTTAPIMNLGEIKTFASRFGVLSEYILEQINAQKLGIRGIADPSSGELEAEIYAPRDLSSTIVFSADFGNLRGYKRKRAAPKANVVYCAGQGEGVDRMFSVVEDTESIALWGRFEGFKDRRDVDEEDDCTSSETPQDKLNAAALEHLNECSAEDSYELDIIPVARMAFWDDWFLGDIVKIVTDTDVFTAQIKEIKLSYQANGIEKIIPSVGSISRGLLAAAFEELRQIKKRLKVLEGKEQA